MKKHLIYSCFAAIILAIALTACGNHEELTPDPPPQTLIASSDNNAEISPVSPFALATYSESPLHPAFGTQQVNIMLAPLLYESLFVLDEAFMPQSQLSHSHTVSDNGLVWTFRLKSGITFSDGTILTGEIVANALLDAAKPESNYAPRLKDVSSITGEGDIVTIILNTANSNLPSLLNIPIPLDSSDRPLGTGPYVLQENGLELSLTLRDNHWQGKTYPLDTIPLNNVRQFGDLVSSFNSSYVTLVDVDLMGTNTVGYSGSYETWDYDTTALIYLGFNTKNGPASSAKLRRTLASSIDRNKIVEVDYARHATATTLPIHPSSPLYDNMLAATAYFDPIVLPTALANITPPEDPLRLLVATENAAKVSTAQQVATTFTALGMPTEVIQLPWDDFLNALESGNFDLYLAEILLTADFDLSPLIASNGNLNYGGWSNGNTDTLLASYRNASAQTRPVAASNLYANLLEQAPIVPICFKNGSVLTQWGRLNQLSPTQSNVFWKMEHWAVTPTSTATNP